MTDSLFFYYSGQTRARGVFCHFLSCSFPHSYPMASGFLGLRRALKHRSSLYLLPFGLQAQRWQVSLSPLNCLISLSDQIRGVVALPPYTNSLLLPTREPRTEPLHSLQEAQQVGVSFSATSVALSPFQTAQLV